MPAICSGICRLPRPKDEGVLTAGVLLRDTRQGSPVAEVGAVDRVPAQGTRESWAQGGEKETLVSLAPHKGLPAGFWGRTLRSRTALDPRLCVWGLGGLGGASIWCHYRGVKDLCGGGLAPFSAPGRLLELGCPGVPHGRGGVVPVEPVGTGGGAPLGARTSPPLPLRHSWLRDGTTVLDSAAPRPGPVRPGTAT